MSVLLSEVRPGAYHDSVVLMQLQRGLLGLPGVIDAGVVMATSANRELLEVADLLPGGAAAAGPDDLLIVVRAEGQAAAREALAQVDALLARRRAAVEQEFRPRSLEGALKLLPDAGWALVSVPGRFAAGVAREALRLGLHVFLYSNNLSLEDEIALKQEARGKGLLVMGPDCGTAIIGGAGLGFANRVRRGAIGLVGASGTGLQAITARVHALGAGVSQAIGVGGRDLKSEVGAITAHQGLDLLARDPETRVIVLVSKPPAPEVAARLLAAAGATGKPVVVDFLGYPPPGRRLGNLHFASSLNEAAELACQLSVVSDQSSVTSDHRPLITDHWLRGLFSGGTLAYEATLTLSATLHPLYSNTPLAAHQLLPDPLHSQFHTLLDLGADEFTVGRLHPMLDNDLRIRRLRQEAADPEVGLILLDVVLGEGAHPDPAGELGPVIEEVISKWGVEVVVMVVGTEADPQGLAGQVERLREAGAIVFTDPAEALEYVGRRFASVSSDGFPPVPLDRFQQTPLAAINIGLEAFHASLLGQGAKAVQVDWRPPAAGNERMMALLAKMKQG